MTRSGHDTDFANLVRQASSGHKPSVERLSELVREGHQFGVGESGLLADMLLAWTPPKRLQGRPSRPKISPAMQRKLISEYLKRTQGGEPAESVANEIYSRSGVNRSTFHKWLSECGKAVQGLEQLGFERGSAIDILGSD